MKYARLSFVARRPNFLRVIAAEIPHARFAPLRGSGFNFLVSPVRPTSDLSRCVDRNSLSREGNHFSFRHEGLNATRLRRRRSIIAVLWYTSVYVFIVRRAKPIRVYIRFLQISSGIWNSRRSLARRKFSAGRSLIAGCLISRASNIFTFYADSLPRRKFLPGRAFVLS